jgi:hypothetical protein
MKPDLVILDLRFHDENECETLGHVIKHKFELPVIVIPAQRIFKKGEASRTEVAVDKINFSDISASRKKIHCLI